MLVARHTLAFLLPLKIQLVRLICYLLHPNVSILLAKEDRQRLTHEEYAAVQELNRQLIFDSKTRLEFPEHVKVPPGDVISQNKALRHNGALLTRYK